MLLLLIKCLLPTGELWGEEGKNPILLVKLTTLCETFLQDSCRIFFLLAIDVLLANPKE